MDESMPSYPPIDPTTFDLIIVGTGLPESLLAAAASSAGKTVLHLDPNPFYGAHFSSLPLHELTAFLQSPPSPPPPPAAPSNGDYIAVDLTARPVYSDVEISAHSPEPLEHSRKFNLDLAGPRVLFCADSAVDLMLRSGASQYMEFKSVDGSFVCQGEGKLLSVPDSRSAVFRDSSLSKIEMLRLGNFFKLVGGHLEAVVSDGGGGGDGDGSSGGRRIAEEDLESPLVEFLNKMRLPPRIKSSILYAIALADYDQDNIEVCKDVLTTKDGINRLELYQRSVGRFPNALGALIYPLYGQGELPQSFCRRAAVKGCIHVLRMAVNALLMDKESGSYKGVKVASGQELFCHHMVLGPSLIVPSPLVKSSPDSLQVRLKDFGLRDISRKVARGVCITKGSLKSNVSTCLVVYPPKSLYPEQVTSIRILQIGSSLAVCPAGMFVCYVSALCDDALQGKKSLHAAVNAIFSVPISGTPENSSTGESESAEVKPEIETPEKSSTGESESAEAKPTLLWSVLYIQEITKCSSECVSSTPMPDGNLNYNDLIDSTKELFGRMFPDEEFFPEAAFSEPEDDSGLDRSPNDVESLDS